MSWVISLVIRNTKSDRLATSVPEGFVGPPSGTLGEALLLGLRGSARLRRFFGFTLSELPAFGFQEVIGMPLAVLGLPVVTTELPFDGSTQRAW